MSDDGRHTRVKPGGGTVVKGRRGRSKPVAKAAEPASLIGRVVGEKYEVTGLVGLGGMGEVYRAVQSPLGREVAVKVIRAAANTRQDRRRRFHREAEVIARLSHSSTVRLYDYFEETDGSLFMVLELIRGHSLRDELRGGSRLAVERVARIALQVLGSLAEAHAMGVVHRDLKPDNLMLVQEQLVGERVKVLDFGIARIVDAAEPATGEQPVPRPHETWDGVVVGSPHYMAPEQARRERAGPQADLYALGAVMFELLSGRPPYAGATTPELLDAHDVAPIPELPADVPASVALRGVVRRALAKQPVDRFADASAMADAIYAAVPEVMVAAAPSGGGAVDDEDEAERTVVETRLTPIDTTGDDEEGTRVVPIEDVPGMLAPQVDIEALHPPPATPDVLTATGPIERPRSPLRLWLAVGGACVGLVLLGFLLQALTREPPPGPAPRVVPAAGPLPDAAVAVPTVVAGDASVVADEPDARRPRPKKRRRPKKRPGTKLRVKKL